MLANDLPTYSLTYSLTYYEVADGCAAFDEDDLDEDLVMQVAEGGPNPNPNPTPNPNPNPTPKP